MLTRALQERYRCPESFLGFHLQEGLSSDPGYFRFGPDVVGYGRCSGGRPKPAVEAPLYDVVPDITVDQGVVGLPFDPDEVIDNLRLERYALHESSASERLLKSLYYCVRPLTNRSLRSRIQRFHARDWRSLSFPRWPVDTTVEDLSERLMLHALEAASTAQIPFIWFWPRGCQGCVLMTHDIETEAGRDYSHELLRIDAAFGIKASFQVVPEERYPVSAQFLDTLRAHGCEIVIQDLNHDGRLFDNREEFLRRAERIRRYAAEYGAQGFRAAVLYRKPEWFDALGIAFDMSIPNVAHLDPQRGGCCTVFPYFIGDVVELPVTTVQDYALFHLLQERSIELWKEQLGLILAKHGLASFIVHPDYIIDPLGQAVYEELLGWLRTQADERRLWIALPGEVNQWWRQRSQMTIVREGSVWRIEGEGADQAVLAFAQKEEGRLTYSLTRSSYYVSA